MSGANLAHSAVSVIPTYLLIVIVKLLPDLTIVSWAS